VEQIAWQTGMGTATTLRRHFSQQPGVPPETYRRTFRPLNEQIRWSVMACGEGVG
jgi:transcriptional regulator GlxA family with amidase domain